MVTPTYNLTIIVVCPIYCIGIYRYIVYVYTKVEDLFSDSLGIQQTAMLRGSLPTPLMDMFITNTDIHLHNTRNVNNPHIQSRTTKIAQKSLRHMQCYEVLQEDGFKLCNTWATYTAFDIMLCVCMCMYIYLSISIYI